VSGTTRSVELYVAARSPDSGVRASDRAVPGVSIRRSGLLWGDDGLPSPFASPRVDPGRGVVMGRWPPGLVRVTGLPRRRSSVPTSQVVGVGWIRTAMAVRPRPPHCRHVAWPSREC
jgi:hypothetical protein